MDRLYQTADAVPRELRIANVAFDYSYHNVRDNRTPLPHNDPLIREFNLCNKESKGRGWCQREWTCPFDHAIATAWAVKQGLVARAVYPPQGPGYAHLDAVARDQGISTALELVCSKECQDYDTPGSTLLPVGRAIEEMQAPQRAWVQVIGLWRLNRIGEVRDLLRLHGLEDQLVYDTLDNLHPLFGRNPDTDEVKMREDYGTNMPTGGTQTPLPVTPPSRPHYP